jgi:hypothetical protein
VTISIGVDFRRTRRHHEEAPRDPDKPLARAARSRDVIVTAIKYGIVVNAFPPSLFVPANERS